MTDSRTVGADEEEFEALGSVVPDCGFKGGGGGAVVEECGGAVGEAVGCVG